MADAKDKKDDGKRPIIVKKVKKISGGHHGGAWKVAYADFVTAMMAFFLLLWLLSTSSKETLSGLSEYFTPTIGVTGAQGIGFKGGTAATIEGTARSEMTTPGVVTGSTPSGQVSEAPEQSPIEAKEEDNLFKQGADAIQQAFSKDPQMQQYQDNVSVTNTPEGLKIDLMDTDKYPMFDPQTASLTTHGQLILARMAPIVKRMPNYMSLTGHTDASPAEAGQVAGYSNWELSSERANAARRYLLQSGVEGERAKKIVGMADKELLVPSEPRNPKNRRISLLMLRGSHILIPDSAVPETQ